MSFDGRNHRGFALAGPIYGHPNACAVGNGASIALAQGYAFGQTQARRLFEQTYRLHLDTPGVYSPNTSEISATTWVSIGRANRYIPAHATHALFDLWASVTGGQSTSVYARIRIYDGVTSYTGDSVNQVLDARPGAELEYGSEASRSTANRALTELRILSSYGGSSLVHLRGSVSLASVALPDDLEINVEAYAVDADTEAVAIPLHPYVTGAWWEVVGG